MASESPFGLQHKKPFDRRRPRRRSLGKFGALFARSPLGPRVPLGNFPPHLSLSPFLSSLLPLALSRVRPLPTKDGAGVQVGRPHLFTQVKHLWRLLRLKKQTVSAVPARHGSFQYGTDSRLTRNAPRVCGNGCRGQEFNQICFATFGKEHF